MFSRTKVFLISKQEIPLVQLKPQDTLLALKYWSMRKNDQSDSVREIAESVGISAGEVSKGSKRLIAARIAVARRGILFIESGALVEWLSYGVRYAYPQESSGYGRGMATSWNCPVLESEMVAPNPALVWPVAGGDADGTFIDPFHDSVPIAASHDELIYKALSLLEAIRGGKPRELTVARRMMNELIKQK